MISQKNKSDGDPSEITYTETAYTKDIDENSISSMMKTINTSHVMNRNMPCSKNSLAQNSYNSLR